MTTCMSRRPGPVNRRFTLCRCLQSANALSFDELQGLTYLQVKGSGIANTCPTLDGGSANIKDLKPGSYSLGKFCMEPTSFTVKEESQVRVLGRRHGSIDPSAGTLCSTGWEVDAALGLATPWFLQFKGGDSDFVSTKLMTRLTYTLDEASLGCMLLSLPLCPLCGSHSLSPTPPSPHLQMSGSFKVDGSGNVELKEEDGIDYAPVTVQLPGGERVPFLFSVKQLEAKVWQWLAFSGAAVMPLVCRWCRG